MTKAKTPSQPADPISDRPVVATLGAWLDAQTQPQTQSQLQARPTQADPFDLQLAACQVLGVSRAQLIAHPEYALSVEQCRQLDAYARRLHAGEPLAYLLGSQEFWSLEFRVSTQVLIPRPETELLVELALAKASLLLADNPTPTFVELGTGSGAISIDLASVLETQQKHLPATKRAKPTYIATDYSRAALAIAQENAQRLGVNVLLLQADWLAAFNRGIDLLISNPPYIAVNDPHLPALKFEPTSALVSGPDGLDDLRTISAQAADRLNPGGWLLFEHGYDQGVAVQQMLHDHGFQAVATKADLAGLDRVTLGQQPPLRM